MNDIHTAPVTAVVPCWRSGSTIRRALASIAAQTLRPAEVILIDDASGDGTLATLHELAAEYQVGWVKIIALVHNQGPGGARNAGWDHAVQPWIAFLDADDAWHPRKIEMQYGWLQTQPDVCLCGHGTAVMAQDGQYPEVPIKPGTWRVNFWKMLVANRFPTRSVMLKRELPFRFEGKQVTEDYLLWLQIVLSNQACYLMETPLAVSFRAEFSPGGYSGDLWRHEKRELAAWRYLHRQDSISLATWLLSSAWSFMKYLRRTLI